MAKAEYNGDGVVDLKSEMIYAHGYYAAGADKDGKTNYLHTVTQAFIDGRKLITESNGEDLTNTQRQHLKAYADVIKTNWEKVIAEALFKYAGAVYADIAKLEKPVANNEDASKLFRTYAKQWGELKGFAMALEAGGKNLGMVGVKLNRLIGYSPVLLGNTQVTGIANGDYVQSEGIGMGEYRVHMIKVQKLLIDTYGIEGRTKDLTAELEGFVNPKKRVSIYYPISANLVALLWFYWQQNWSLKKTLKQ